MFGQNKIFRFKKPLPRLGVTGSKHKFPTLAAHWFWAPYMGAVGKAKRFRRGSKRFSNEMVKV